jgi:hypothetical protein
MMMDGKWVLGISEGFDEGLDWKCILIPPEGL